MGSITSVARQKIAAARRLPEDVLLMHAVRRFPVPPEVRDLGKTKAFRRDIFHGYRRAHELRRAQLTTGRYLEIYENGVEAGVKSLLIGKKPKTGCLGGGVDQAYLSDLATQVTGKIATAAGVPGGLAVLNHQPSNILDLINVRVHDVGNKRRVTVNMPPGMSFADIYKAIRAVPGRQSDGIWQDGPLMAGPKADKVPVGKQSFTIYFGINDRSRNEQAAYIAGKGQRFADPWVVAMAEAAQLAKHGMKSSLFRYNNADYFVRVKKSENKRGFPVWDLLSRYGEVNGVRYADDDFRVDNMVAVGSSFISNFF